MAADQNSPDLSNLHFDLDEIVVDILFLCRNPKLLVSTETFLTRRGWNVKVTSDVAKAIEIIAEQRPDFLITSLNHSSPAIMKLPDLVKSTFNVICVGFTEILDTASSSKLNRSNYPHKMMGQVSGPNVHRLVRKILAERLGLKEDGSRHTERDRGDRHAESPVTKTNGVIIQGSSALKGPATTMFKDNSSSGTDILSTGTYTMAKKSTRSLKDIAKAQASAGLGTPDAVDPGSVSADTMNMLKRSLFGDTLAEQKAAAVSSAPQTPAELVEKTVEVAFSEVCDMQGGEIHGVLSIVNRIGVFPVNSKSTPGYLVVASSMNERDSEEFFRMSEVTLQKAFISMGLGSEIEAGFAISIPNTDFGSWTAEQAAFTIVLAHRGYEVGAAFFPTGERLPSVRESQHEGMVSVELANIKSSAPVNFKAYLHLKKNNKFFLYLRDGRALQPEQKVRLKDGKVADLYMKTVDRENIRMYLAAAFLRDTMKKSA